MSASVDRPSPRSCTPKSAREPASTSARRLPSSRATRYDARSMQPIVDELLLYMVSINFCTLNTQPMLFPSTPTGGGETWELPFLASEKYP